MKVVVTAGAKGADIDVFACVVAYAELLNLEGEEGVPVITGKFTSSVTPQILSWGAKYRDEYEPDGSENFVLVDISDPNHFPSFVDHEHVSEIYDHRYGHEDLWEERLGTKAKIDMVGACGTLVWEEFLKRNQGDKISEVSARLLLASIVSNTLNFKSPQTTDRDKAAYEQLFVLSNLSDNWIEQYFKDQESLLFNEFKKYVKADTKVSSLPNGDFAIGQIELWDAERVLDEKLDELQNIMSSYDPLPWIVNIINISKGFNYVYSKSDLGQEALANILGLIFDDGVAKTKGLLMRKHIMKKLYDFYVK